MLFTPKKNGIWEKTIIDISGKTNGFSLTEILVSISIMFILIMTFVPLILMSFDTIIKSGEKSDRIMRSHGNIEIVLATKEGLLAEDGSFIPVTDGSFPLRISGSTTDVAGGKVEVDELKAYLAATPNIKLNPFALNEGYSPDNPSSTRRTIQVISNNTHFRSGMTYIEIRDKDNVPVAPGSYGGFSVDDSTFWLSTSTSLTASGSPYYVTITTGSETVRTALIIYPALILAVGDDGTILSSSDNTGDTWITKASGTSENLLDSFYNDNLGNNGKYVIVGSEGTVLTSADANSWSDKSLNINEDINSIERGNSQYIAAGEGGIILGSANGSLWTKPVTYEPEDSDSSLVLWLKADSIRGKSDGDEIDIWENEADNNAAVSGAGTYPKYKEDALNGLPAVHFEGTDWKDDYDAMSLPEEAVVRDDFTIIMVARAIENHQIDSQSDTGVEGVWEQHYIFNAAHGGAANAGAGLSFGTNGVSSYEHGDNYMPPKAVYEGDVNGFNIITLQYDDKRPSIYLNSSLVAEGTISSKDQVDSPDIIGNGSYGHFTGDIAELLVYDTSLDDSEKAKIEQYLRRKYGLNSLNSIEWSREKYHAVGDNGVLRYSEDGTTWYALLPFTNSPLNAIVEGNDLFVAVGDADEEGLIFTSTDGIDWTKRESPTFNNLNGIAGNGSCYIAVGDNGTILRSTNGTTWTVRNSGTANNLNGVDGSAGMKLWVAVGDNGTILTSTDNGLNWTGRTSGTTNRLNNVRIR